MPEDLFGALRKVQDTNVICATAISQYAALGALEEGPAYCGHFVREMAEVRQQGIKAQRVSALGRSRWQSTGAFYFLWSCRVSQVTI